MVVPKLMVELRAGERDKVFDAYPNESIAAWHQRLAWRVTTPERQRCPRAPTGFSVT